MDSSVVCDRGKGFRSLEDGELLDLFYDMEQMIEEDFDSPRFLYLEVLREFRRRYELN